MVFVFIITVFLLFFVLERWIHYYCSNLTWIWLIFLHSKCTIFIHKYQKLGYIVTSSAPKADSTGLRYFFVFCVSRAFPDSNLLGFFFFQNLTSSIFMKCTIWHDVFAVLRCYLQFVFCFFFLSFLSLQIFNFVYLIWLMSFADLSDPSSLSEIRLIFIPHERLLNSEPFPLNLKLSSLEWLYGV